MAKEKAVPTLSIDLYGGKYKAEFFDKAHRYTINGTRKKSVTTILGVCKETEILMMWAVKMAKQHLVGIIENGQMVTLEDIYEAANAWRVKRDTAASLGTQVHDWIELYIKAERAKEEDPELPSDEKVLNGVTGFLQWVSEHEVEFIDSERIVYSEKYDYTGKLDCIANVDGKLTLIDFKTGNFVGMEAHWQCSAYLAAIEEETAWEFKDRIILQINKDLGTVQPHTIGMSMHEMDFEAFLGCLAVKKRKDWKEAKI